MANRLLERLLPKEKKQFDLLSWVRSVVSGSLIRMSDVRSDTSIKDIHTQIDTMRALARDAQISTALSYYATDATTTNSQNQILWATSDIPEVAKIINALFTRWDINRYARDHILELATIGNLYLPTTIMYREVVRDNAKRKIALDNNTIPDKTYDIVASTKIPPENVLHLWFQGQPEGYVYDENVHNSDYILYPEAAIIHFSLGGLLGDYTIEMQDGNKDTKIYDIQFAQPLMEKAVQPTQTLSLLEDAVLLSSMIQVVRFVNVNVGGAADEEEMNMAMQLLKDKIEQQMSIHTGSGDAQSFVNPQSPRNLIFLPRINDQDPVTITNLDMTAPNAAESELLKYYQDNKLSVLGVPKEAMNFSSNEGLGGAGSVLAQRSALYANALERLMTAYKTGWKQAINHYFTEKGYSGYIDQFDLHMSPILTERMTIESERRDATLNQAMTLVELMQNMGITQMSDYRDALIEILADAFPHIGASIRQWAIDVDNSTETI